MQNELISGRYRITRPIGRGGMGTVWLCRDEVLDRDVAIKQIGSLPGEEGADGAARARREARLAASLNHPNAVSIYDVVEHEGKPWLVMEYFQAENLSEIIKERGKLPPRDIAPIAAQVAKALAAAHRAGIVHRDVKPSNILVDEFGIAKITDFGIAKANTDPQLTRTGMMAGTPAYFAPELARGRTPAPPSDVWALGASIFHALEGRPPYGLDSNTIAMLYRIGVEKPAESQHAGKLAPALSHLLDTDADRRWSMAMAADKLGELANPNANISMSEATSAALPKVPPIGPGAPGGPAGGTPPTGSQYSAGWGQPFPTTGAQSYPSTGSQPYPGAGSQQYPQTGAQANTPTGAQPYPASGVQQYPPTGAQHPMSGAQPYAAIPPHGPPTQGAITAAEPPPDRKGRGLLIGLTAAATVAAIILAVVLIVRGNSSDKKDASDPSKSDAPTSQSQQETPTSSSAPTSQSDQFSEQSAPSKSSNADSSVSSTTQSGGVGSGLDPQQMTMTVEMYYGLLPDDIAIAHTYLTGGLAQDYASYEKFWNTVNSISCQNFEPDAAASTVKMTCTYDMADKTVQQTQIAHLVKGNDGNYYISAMDVPKESIVSTPK